MTSAVLRSSVCGIVAAILVSLPAPAVLGAQRPDGEQFFDVANGRPGDPARLLGPLARILVRLNLTADERGEIRQIVLSHRSELQALLRRGVETRRVLFEAVFLDAFDEGVIRDRSAGVAAVQADEAVLRATIRTEIFRVLTPEQQARAVAVLKAFENRLRGQIDASSGQ